MDVTPERPLPPHEATMHASAHATTPHAIPAHHLRGMGGCGARPSPPDPTPVDPGMRADDAARRDVASALGVHLAEGRLDMTEYEDLLDQTFAARTHGDLDGILAGLPHVTTPADRVRQQAAARRTVGGWLALCALFVTIWLLTGADFFWPIFPIMGTAFGYLPTAWAQWQGSQVV